MNAVVVGSGAWGTALAMVLVKNGHHVTLWSRREEQTNLLRTTRENPRLTGVTLPEELHYSSSLDCLADADLVVLATPSIGVRETARSIRPHLKKDAVVVSVTKGIEPGTGLRMSEIAAQETGCIPAALSGPTHAEEVSRNLPTGCVAASEDEQTADFIQDAFMNETFRVYTSSDIAGVELGAALKNVIAMSAGITDGLGFGDNTKALLMTRGLTEIARLGMQCGARQETFTGLSGVGDLIVTCTSMHSRNRRAGILVGKGASAEDAMKEVGAIVEGYYATESAWEMAHRLGVEMPIVDAMHRILYGGADPQDMVRNLMTRRKKHETEDPGWMTR